MAELAEGAEAIEEVVEVAVEASRGLSSRDACFLFIGFGTGIVIGGFIAGRVLEKKYQELAESEIDIMRDHFRARNIAREEKPDLGDYRSKVGDLGYSEPNAPDPEEMQDEVVPSEEEEARHSAEEVDAVVDQELEETEERKAKSADEGWDYEEEIRLRRPDRPYIIHEDERRENNSYTEVELVYYEGDDLLADENNKVITDPEVVVGADNLGKFGHGSSDHDAIYVRNDQLGVEIFVLKNTGNYSEIVHGMVRHAGSRKSMKPRRRIYDDE